MRPLHGILAVIAILLPASLANAGMHTYRLGDIGDEGNSSPPARYGISLEGVGNPSKYFSFGLPGASVKMTYFDGALSNGANAKTARLVGTVIENVEKANAGDTYFEPGDAWALDYTYTGITDLGSGYFKVLEGTGSGSGTLTKGTEVINLSVKANRSGLYFSFTDGNRNPAGSYGVGEGWLNDLPGDNDFLFSARVVPEPTTLAILATGAPVLLMRSRRRRR